MLTGRVALPLSAAVALVVLAVSGRILGAAAGWAALATAAFGAQLQLIDVPRSFAGFQHFRLDTRDAVLLGSMAILVTQALALATVGRRHVQALATLLRKRWWIALLVIAAMAVTSAAPSADPRRYVLELALGTAIELLAVLSLFAAVRSVPEHAVPHIASLTDRVLGPVGAAGPARTDRWVLVVATGAGVIAALLAWAVYERHPHVPDETVYLIHARYLAAGHLWLPLPPVPEAFLLDLMQYEPTRWYSPVPPGWPAVLAVGTKLGVPWLVNPALGIAAVVLTYRVLGTMYSLRTSRLATLLLATSPWFLFMAMSFMTHTLTLVCALLAALGVARARREGAPLAAFGAGLAVGMVSLIRPLDGLVTAALLGLWSLGASGRGLRRLVPATALTIGSMLMGAAVLPYNARLTGSAREFPLLAYTDKYYEPGANALGFGPNRGLGWGGSDPFPGHSPLEAAINTVVNAFQINVELLGWPTGATIVLALAIAFGVRRLNRPDIWQLGVIVAIAGIHAFYWFAGGPDFGARYWYLVIVSCVVLAARGVEQGEAALARRETAMPNRLMASALLLCVLSLSVYVPWRSFGKYHHYRRMRPDVRELAHRSDWNRALVLVRGPRHPDYASAAAYNPVDLRSDAPIFAWDTRRTTREQVIQAFPDRAIWFVDGPSLTGDGYRVIAGPLTSEQALASPIPIDIAGDEIHAYDPVNPPPRRRDGSQP